MKKSAIIRTVYSLLTGFGDASYNVQTFKSPEELDNHLKSLNCEISKIFASIYFKRNPDFATWDDWQEENDYEREYLFEVFINQI